MATDTDVTKSELIAFVTAPDEGEATRLAEALVSERLAACVNIVGGIESIYRWEGKIARDREVLLIIKTTGERYDALERRVKELHSYTTPEVIAFSVERGSREYLDWLRRSTEVS
ncbi:MAG TPA: divalent-cation tolerance protein CutA [Blastocatellia bacterium]|jgi:periplasmic divalent cation tolerance protein|nr:divalent-cation tolerance protein CutA [Blastocatellia bacterium]